MNAKQHYYAADHCARQTARKQNHSHTRKLAHREWQARCIASRPDYREGPCGTPVRVQLFGKRSRYGLFSR